jgi:hypothetical protein
MEAANECLKQHYLPAFNAELSHRARETGSAFIPLAGINLDDYLCQRYERVVGKDNSIQFQGVHLQIPQDRHRYQYVKARVKVLRHLNGMISVYHGPRRLGQYTANGELIQGEKENNKAA